MNVQNDVKSMQACSSSGSAAQEQLCPDTLEFLEKMQGILADSKVHIKTAAELRDAIELADTNSQKLGERFKNLKAVALGGVEQMESMADAYERMAHLTETTRTQHVQLQKACAKAVEYFVPLLQEFKVEEMAPAMIALQVLERTMQMQLTEKVAKAPKEVKTPTPWVINDAKELAAALSDLHLGLIAMMKAALDPSQTTDYSGFRKELAFNKGVFQELKARFESTEKGTHDLRTSIESKLNGLEKQVKEYESSPIPLAHVDSIAIYARSSSQSIIAEIEARKEIHKQRLEKHDELAEAYAQTLVRMRIIDWELQRMEKFAHLETSVNQLSNNLAALSREIEEIKTLKRDHPETTLEDMQGRFERNVVRVFNDQDHAQLGASLREESQQYLQSLGQILEGQESALAEEVGKIVFYNPEVKQRVEGELKDTVATVLREVKSKQNSFSIAWRNVFDLLDKKDVREKLPYEINRMGVTLYKYQGNFPKDFTYGYLWSPDKDYVVSPFAPPKPVVEEKKNSEESSSQQASSSNSHEG